MEPLAIASVLSNLISIGLRTHKALDNEGFGDAEFEALRTYLDSGSSMLSRFKAKADPRPAAMHLALTSQAFGQALARHWGGNLKAWLQGNEKKRQKEIELRTTHAELRLRMPGDKEVGLGELELLGALTGQPEKYALLPRLVERIHRSELERGPVGRRTERRRFATAPGSRRGPRVRAAFSAGVCGTDGHALGSPGDRVVAGARPADTGTDSRASGARSR